MVGESVWSVTERISLTGGGGVNNRVKIAGSVAAEGIMHLALGGTSDPTGTARAFMGLLSTA